MIDLHAELKGTYEILTAPEAGSEISFVNLKPQESWSYFHGHFPSRPILPAVAILDISHYFIEHYWLKEKVRLQKISFFKIKRPIHPGNSLIIKLQQENPKKFLVGWSGEGEDSVTATLVVEIT